MYTNRPQVLKIRTQNFLTSALGRFLRRISITNSSALMVVMLKLLKYELSFLTRDHIWACAPLAGCAPCT